jgi:5-methyltetrahydrofolate--homocysteine methyltransferase
MLYGKHMGLKGQVRERVETGDEKALKLVRLFDELKEDYRGGAVQARAVWQFFQAQSCGNMLRLFKDGRLVEQFDFPRQPGDQGLCLSDYVWDEGRPRRDSVCLLAVTAGIGVRETFQRYKYQGEFLKSHGIQALALETAEALAEWLHATIRAQWGFPDPSTMTMRERFQSRYRGKRFSFGYPACPALEDQAKLWRLLRPEELGIELTEGFMMSPEASVSAIVFHHPQARYFSVE